MDQRAAELPTCLAVFWLPGGEMRGERITVIPPSSKTPLPHFSEIHHPLSPAPQYHAEGSVLLSIHASDVKQILNKRYLKIIKLQHSTTTDLHQTIRLEVQIPYFTVFRYNFIQRYVLKTFENKLQLLLLLLHSFTGSS